MSKTTIISPSTGVQPFNFCFSFLGKQQKTVTKSKTSRTQLSSEPNATTEV
jgi:hypothetical protein